MIQNFSMKSGWEKFGKKFEKSGKIRISLRGVKIWTFFFLNICSSNIISVKMKGSCTLDFRVFWRFWTENSDLWPIWHLRMAMNAERNYSHEIFPKCATHVYQKQKSKKVSRIISYELAPTGNFLIKNKIREN